LEEGSDYKAGVLLGEGVPETIKGSLDWLEAKGYVEWLAYVIMPDHLHLLFKLLEPVPLSKVLQRFSQYTGRQIGLRLERQGGIWQESYFDRAIRNEDELQRAFAYIKNNPVKAGYIEEAGDWPWLFPKM
jgi:REP element-mobilizing transposase RayT